MNAPQEITEAQFFEMVDRYIAQANEYGQRFRPPPVSAALLFAAARFNAFNWVNRSEQRSQTVDEATRLFAAEYQKMFRDNVESLESMRAKN